jgi:phosphatidylinositol glycan class M
MGTRPTFWSAPIIIPLAILLRITLILYGRWHDAHHAIKYTDIDYLVFTDAARAVARGQSPYARATYRYTPALAWLLVPTTWGGGGGWWFEFGKGVFAAGDVATGALVVQILRGRGMAAGRAWRFASIWLLNPMVANISTRGSSEGLLAGLVVAVLGAALRGRVAAAGAVLGVAVHFKIYPFVYAASLFWWLGDDDGVGGLEAGSSWGRRVGALVNRDRVVLAGSSFVVFMGLNLVMYQL